jgi:hypothetical protein
MPFVLQDSHLCYYHPHSRKPRSKQNTRIRVPNRLDCHGSYRIHQRKTPRVTYTLLHFEWNYLLLSVSRYFISICCCIKAFLLRMILALLHVVLGGFNYTTSEMNLDSALGFLRCWSILLLTEAPLWPYSPVQSGSHVQNTFPSISGRSGDGSRRIRGVGGGTYLGRFGSSGTGGGTELDLL